MSTAGSSPLTNKRNLWAVREGGRERELELCIRGFLRRRSNCLWVASHQTSALAVGGCCLIVCWSYHQRNTFYVQAFQKMERCYWDKMSHLFYSLVQMVFLPLCAPVCTHRRAVRIPHDAHVRKNEISQLLWFMTDCFRTGRCPNTLRPSTANSQQHNHNQLLNRQQVLLFSFNSRSLLKVFSVLNLKVCGDMIKSAAAQVIGEESGPCISPKLYISLSLFLFWLH